MPRKLLELLTVDQVAQVTGWKPSTIRQKCWRKEMKLGKSVRFKESEILRIIEDSSVPALEASGAR